MQLTGQREGDSHPLLPSCRKQLVNHPPPRRVPSCLPRPALPRPPQSLVSGPLVSVQASLMKDVAVWTRGLYSVPSLVPLALGQQLQLADRLSALQLVVRDTPPVVHGHLSGWVFATLVAPMHKDVLVSVAVRTSP